MIAYAGPKVFKVFLWKNACSVFSGNPEETTFAVLHRWFNMFTACEDIHYSASSDRDVYLKIALCDNKGWVKKTPECAAGGGNGSWEWGSSSLPVGRQGQRWGELLARVSSHFQKLGARERQTAWPSTRAAKILSFLLEFKGINTASQFTVVHYYTQCLFVFVLMFVVSIGIQWTNFFLTCMTFSYSCSQNTFSVRYGLASITPLGNGKSSINCNKVWTLSYSIQRRIPGR